LARGLRGVAGGLLRVDADDADDAVGHALVAVLSVQLERQFRFASEWRRLEQPVASLCPLVWLGFAGIRATAVGWFLRQSGRLGKSGQSGQSGQCRWPGWCRQPRRLRHLRRTGPCVHFRTRLDQAAVAIVGPVTGIRALDLQQRRTAFGCRRARLANRADWLRRADGGARPRW
jgi:hypothetical protein